MLPKSFVAGAKKVVSKDATRPGLQYVHMDGRHAVATDGHVLLAAEYDADGEGLTGFIDVKGLKAADAVISKNGNGLVAQQGNATVSCDATDLTFPVWRNVVPGHVGADGCPEGYGPLLVGVNPRRLADALYAFDGLPKSYATIYRKKKDGELQVLVIKGTIDGKPALALVMPVRVPK